MSDAAFAARALAEWKLRGARPVTALHRENTVWRVASDHGDFALRIHRRGLRQPDEIGAELSFMAHLAAGGLSVPAPQPNRQGGFWVEQDGLLVDVLTWVPGRPLPTDTATADRATAYHALGRDMARLHALADDWRPAGGICRPVWDLDGISGSSPVWGRWQDHPALLAGDLSLMDRAEQMGRAALGKGTQDFGPIHADLVVENVLYDGAQPWLIDFDDFGTGYRLFDLATVILRAEREADFDTARAALLQGYLASRRLDLAALPAMMALRSLTYLGWITPRLDEPGGAERSTRFLERARRHCVALIG